MHHIYDHVIIGGGIAGIYTFYQLTAKYPSASILLLEKSGRWGGRVYTYIDSNFTVEAGAGRFSDDHKILLSLIKELGLKPKIAPASTQSVYINAQTKEQYGSTLDAPTELSEIPYRDIISSAIHIQDNLPDTQRIAGHVLDTYLGQPIIPNAGLIANVILSSKFESKETLQHMNFIEYASQFLTPQQVQYIKDSFGYYSELVVMNAYDALELMNQLGPLNAFFTMKGGLEQIIHKMVEKIKSRIQNNPHSKMKKNAEVINIKYVQRKNSSIYFPTYPYFEIVTENIKTQSTHIYRAKKCICALPRPALENMNIFSPIINTHIRKVMCEPLCRIYTKFRPDKDTGRVWFHDLPKATTNNNLRMIIPIDKEKGVIMLSYTDNKYAKFWKKVNDNNTDTTQPDVQVTTQLVEYAKELFPDKEIERPISTKIFYWNCGVGYWGIGADSHTVSKEILQPFHNVDLYICGENYSEKHQQWIEGALETAQQVVELI